MQEELRIPSETSGPVPGVRRVRCALCISGWLLLVCFSIISCRENKPPPPPPAIPVTAAKVLVRNQPVTSEYVGQTRGSTEVEIRARVEGYLESIHFEEGKFVKEGDPLYTIDRRPYEANLAAAQGELARAQAAWANAKQDLTRFGPLIERNAISRQQYDEAVANEKATAAAVESAQAAVESAKLQLGYTRVTAPVSGRIGKSEVEIGNLVGRGELTVLTTISTVDPINVRFSVSEKRYLEWARAHRGETNQPSMTNRFEMVLADGTLYSHRGNLVFADRNVDLTTGTLLIEVAFPNPDYLIRPGQYARVRVASTVVTNAILVPQRAVQQLQATYSVFVVTPENKAEARTVETGARVDGLWVIQSGLASNEVVVIEGAQKLQMGATVQPHLVEIESESTAGEQQPPGP